MGEALELALPGRPPPGNCRYLRGPGPPAPRRWWSRALLPGGLEPPGQEGVALVFLQHLLQGEGVGRGEQLGHGPTCLPIPRQHSLQRHWQGPFPPPGLPMAEPGVESRAAQPCGLLGC